MKKTSLFAALSVLILVIACVACRSTRDVPRISKDDLRVELESPRIVLIDVRSESDWRASAEKITGSVRMDPSDVDSWAGTLPRDKEIILYCA